MKDFINNGMSTAVVESATYFDVSERVLNLAKSMKISYVILAILR